MWIPASNALQNHQYSSSVWYNLGYSIQISHTFLGQLTMFINQWLRSDRDAPIQAHFQVPFKGGWPTKDDREWHELAVLSYYLCDQRNALHVSFYMSLLFIHLYTKNMLLVFVMRMSTMTVYANNISPNSCGFYPLGVWRLTKHAQASSGNQGAVSHRFTSLLHCARFFRAGTYTTSSTSIEPAARNLKVHRISEPLPKWPWGVLFLHGTIIWSQKDHFLVADHLVEETRVHHG